MPEGWQVVGYLIISPDNLFFYVIVSHLKFSIYERFIQCPACN